jgi:glycolate oxidase FAD binding subunit
MQTLRPETSAQLADALATAAGKKDSIRIGGAFSKDAMAGPLPEADVVISTSALTHVLRYEPRDLTISVEAGLKFAELRRMVEADGMMLPLDPPFSDQATVGGVVAAATCGPRRRLYGTVRDFVIGLRFATLEGKLADSGGMVVKNVAGLDMAKLMIGSFGTLAPLVSVNFKLIPRAPRSRTFVQPFASLAEAVATRDTILQGVLQPAAVDLLNPPAAARLKLEGYALLVQAAGNASVLDRYARQFPSATVLEEEGERRLWGAVREFTPDFLREQPETTVVRISSRISELQAVMASVQGPALARAASGVAYAYLSDPSQAPPGGKSVIEFAPQAVRQSCDLWPHPGNDLELMKKIKQMFDPQHLLNRGRLYGRI